MFKTFVIFRLSGRIIQSRNPRASGYDVGSHSRLCFYVTVSILYSSSKSCILLKKYPHGDKILKNYPQTMAKKRESRKRFFFYFTGYVSYSGSKGLGLPTSIVTLSTIYFPGIPSAIRRLASSRDISSM